MNSLRSSRTCAIKVPSNLQEEAAISSSHESRLSSESSLGAGPMRKIQTIREMMRTPIPVASIPLILQLLRQIYARRRECASESQRACDYPPIEVAINHELI